MKKSMKFHALAAACALLSTQSVLADISQNANVIIRANNDSGTYGGPDEGVYIYSDENNKAMANFQTNGNANIYSSADTTVWINNGDANNNPASFVVNDRNGDASGYVASINSNAAATALKSYDSSGKQVTSMSMSANTGVVNIQSDDTAGGGSSFFRLDNGSSAISAAVNTTVSSGNRTLLHANTNAASGVDASIAMYGASDTTYVGQTFIKGTNGVSINATNAGDVTIGNGSSVNTINGSNNAMTADTSNTISAGTTNNITGGTGNAITATTGDNSITATAGANTISAGTINTINATTANNLTAVTNNLSATGVNGINNITATALNSIQGPVNNIGTGSASSNNIGNATETTNVTAQGGNAGMILEQHLAGMGVTQGTSGLATRTDIDGNAVANSATRATVTLTNTAGASVDANGKLTDAQANEANGTVIDAPTAALTLTNGYGNTHGIVVTESQTTISGGTQSSSMTLADNGATFSDAATGAPIQVHGVADGSSDFDAVNVRQLYGAVAASMATAPQITGLQAGESGIGIGTGYYGGYGALGIAVTHITKKGAQLNLGVATGLQSGTKTAVRAGVGWKF